MNWSTPLKQTSLQRNQIHVWKATLDVSENKHHVFWSYLSDDEKQRANTFYFKKDRDYFITARGILRELIGQYLNKKAIDIEFGYHTHGKPFMRNDAELEFNISHSKNMALYGFVKKDEIGVDIEFVDQKIEAMQIARHFFSSYEITALGDLPQQHKASGFFNCWTRKEAFIKALGTGLSFPLDQFAVSLAPEKKATLVHTMWDTDEAQKWNLFHVNPQSYFTGAVAIKGKVNEIRHFKYN
ncbi:MAG: 4'-phosphopantetheinyl transferase superfamily protein [Flavobacteriaceae bacterium]|nr:MAG: 4'-phosphopantetheinyl transferase superfamily protein [Flavobacteriaceae bacterium]